MAHSTTFLQGINYMNLKLAMSTCCNEEDRHRQNYTFHQFNFAEMYLVQNAQYK